MKRAARAFLFLAIATLGSAAWSPDKDDLAALKANLVALLPAGYSLQTASGSKGEPELIVDSRGSPTPDRHRGVLSIRIHPPMDRQEWKSLHDKQQRLLAEYDQLKPKLAKIPFVGNAQKAANSDQQAVLDRLKVIRQELPKNLPELWYRSLGLSFVDFRTTQPDDAEYILGPEYKEWTIFVKSLLGGLQQDGETNAPKPVAGGK